MASRIAGITIEIGGDTTKLTSALKGVDKSIKATQTSLKDVNKLLELDPKNTELLEQKQKLLKRAIDETKDRLTTLQRAAEQSDLGADEHDAIQREILETQSKLEGLEEEYRQFGSTAKQQLEATKQKLAETGDKITSVGKTMSKVGGVLSASVTAPLVGIGTKAAASFAEVDKTMQLTNKTMGSTVEEAELLNDAMKDAAANSVYGMTDAATATLNFARAGLDAEQAAAALAPAMNLAAGEGGNLDTVSAGLVATINGFHGAFSEASSYADIFAAACNNSALDVDSLSHAMSVAAPIFASAGYSVRDAALYMGVMANNGIDADKAANSLKTGIARLVSPAKDGADMMEALGISVTNADGSMKDSVEIQRELHDAFAGLSESAQIAAASAIFGKNQMAPWLALINTAPDDVNALNDALLNCSGTTEEMAQTMMGGFGGSLEQLKSGIDVLVTSLGEALAPTIQKVVGFVQGLVDKFNALSPAQQETVAKIALVVAAIGPAIAVIGGLTSGIGKLISGFSAILSPAGLVVAAIAAIVAIGVTLYKHWDEIKEWASEKWNAIKDRVTGAIDKVKTSVKEGWENVKERTREAWDNVKTKVAETAEGVRASVAEKWESVKTKTAETWEAVRSKVHEKWESIKSKVSEAAQNVRARIEENWNASQNLNRAVWEAVASKISEKWEAIKTKTAEAAESVRQKVSDAWENLKSKTAEAWENIRSKIAEKWEAIKSTVHNAAEAVKQKAMDAWGKVQSAFSGGAGTIRAEVTPRITGIDWHADAMRKALTLDGATIFGAVGGRLQGGGEAGREVISGEAHLMSMIRQATGGDTLARYAEAYLPYLAEIAEKNLDVSLDGKSITRAVEREITRTQRIRGLQGGMA